MVKRQNRYFHKDDIPTANKSMKSHPPLLAIRKCKLQCNKTPAQQLAQPKIDIIANADNVGGKKKPDLSHIDNRNEK